MTELVDDELEPGETVIALLPFASTPRKPREPGEGRVKEGVWQSSGRYRPLLFTNRRLFVLATGRTPHPQAVQATFPIDRVRMISTERASFGRQRMVLALPDLGNVPFIIGRYDQSDFAAVLAVLDHDLDQDLDLDQK